MNLDHQPLTREATSHTMAAVTAQRETHGTCLEVGHKNSPSSNVTEVGEKTKNIPEAMHVCVQYS